MMNEHVDCSTILGFCKNFHLCFHNTVSYVTLDQDKRLLVVTAFTSWFNYIYICMIKLYIVFG